MSILLRSCVKTPASRISSFPKRRLKLGESRSRCEFFSGRWWALGLVVSLVGCGYTTSVHRPDGRPHLIFVPQVREMGIDVDAGALVGRAVRSEVARTAGLGLIEDAARADFELQVEILDLSMPQEAFVDAALRAPEYTARVTLRGTVTGARLTTPWVLNARGAAPFVSPPGRIEALEGLSRRAFQAAAERAGEQLVLALALRLRALPVDGSTKERLTSSDGGPG